MDYVFYLQKNWDNIPVSRFRLMDVSLKINTTNSLFLIPMSRCKVIDSPQPSAAIYEIKKRTSLVIQANVFEQLSLSNNQMAIWWVEFSRGKSISKTFALKLPSNEAIRN